jgi:hypothetical protein
MVKTMNKKGQVMAYFFFWLIALAFAAGAVWGVGSFIMWKPWVWPPIVIRIIAVGIGVVSIIIGVVMYWRE